ncbi:MAG: hypothetical protein JXA99_15950 [Candidatus Lokiarchaeota archaeon]|nr:hypothetical protein [Candidatus Lokiarchaeota archaeon]
MKESNEKNRDIDTSDNNTNDNKDKNKKKGKRSQGQILEEVLGLEEGFITKIEKRLFIARFMDYFASETLDFIYRDKHYLKYKEQVQEIIESMSKEYEEDILLKQSFESKQIFSILDQTKNNAEKFAMKKGFNQSIDKKTRNYSLIMTIPLIVLVLLFSFIQTEWAFYALFPILCVFCTVSSYPRRYFSKKWNIFKEENKLDFYEDNKEEITILKAFIGEALENVRTRLLDSKVPLQLIKFVLYGNDYQNIKVLDSRTQRGTTQYFLSFEYPPGIDPFPIPESLSASMQESDNKLEENFIILKNIKSKNGIINEFIPTFKEDLAKDINNLLNKCKFEKVSQEINDILLDYSPEKGIYCKCGEYMEINSIQNCTWMKKFKFYLFEGKTCKCGEKVYAISLINENDEIPQEFEKIFLN